MAKQDSKKENSDISSTKRGLQKGYNRSTFIVREELLDSLQYLSYYQDMYIKDLVNEAIEQYIKKWESENNKIPKRKNK